MTTMNHTTLQVSNRRLIIAFVVIFVASAVVPEFSSAADGIAPLLAQENATGQATGGPTVIRAQRSYILDAIIVVLFFGGAIFVVVRSSRRS